MLFIYYKKRFMYFNSVLEELYEALGNIISLQYGGSLLVHTIETYRSMTPNIDAVHFSHY